LNNPAVLEPTSLSAAEKKSLGGLAAGFNKATTEPIRCTLFEQRSDANEWIYRRHTGFAEGEGRIDWGPLQKQRFEGDRTVLDVIEFMHRNGGYTPQDWDSIYKSLANNSTNLKRFLDAKVCSEFLGLATEKRGNKLIPVFRKHTTFVVQALKQIFSDLENGTINSRTYNTAAEMEPYFAALRKALNGLDDKDAENKAFRDINDTVPASDDGSRSPTNVPESQLKPKMTRSRAPRLTLAPRSHEFKQPETTKGQALIREAGRLNADEFPLACAYVLRAILEHTIDIYMDANKIPRQEQNKSGTGSIELNLLTRAERVIQHLINSGLAPADKFRGVRSVLTNKGDPVSIQSLNDYHHSAYRIPTADTLRAAWESAVPLFIAVYGKA
jgi:hypothetical protein